MPTLTPGNVTVARNTVRRHARWKRTYMAGVRWGGVNTTIAANHVSDGPHNCMLGGGNEIPAALCTHEGNLIERCAYESSDTGAWYSCGQRGPWINRGNVARNNTFRHIRCQIRGRAVEGCGGGVQALCGALFYKFQGGFSNQGSFGITVVCTGTQAVNCTPLARLQSFLCLGEASTATYQTHGRRRRTPGPPVG